MSYLDNSNDGINSQILNNNIDNDEKLFLMIFDDNKDKDEESSNNNEHLYLNKSTAHKTNIFRKDEIKENEEDEKEENILPPKQYRIDDIKKILNSKFNEEIFIEKDNLLDLEIKMSDKVFLAPKKRKRDKENEVNTEKKKCGRKKKDDINAISLHKKDCQDNIVKKIKSKINGFLLMFINIILNISLTPNKKKSYIKIIKNIPEGKDPENEDLLKDLDYNKTVNETSKEKNLEFLNMPLKDYLSIDISKQFKTYSKKSNKKVIDELIKNEKDNEIIMFILNDLTLRDFIDIFLYKKELKDFKKIDEEKANLIMKVFKRVDTLIEEIDLNENENNYKSNYLYIFYNYERWFFIKKQRKSHKKKKLSKNKEENEKLK